MYFQVVKPGKNAFLGNPQTPGKHCKVQAVIRLQRVAQQVANKAHQLIIISGPERLIKRNVILINQQDNLLAAMLFKKLGERLEAVNQCIIGHGIF